MQSSTAPSNIANNVHKDALTLYKEGFAHLISLRDLLTDQLKQIIDNDPIRSNSYKTLLVLAHLICDFNFSFSHNSIQELLFFNDDKEFKQYLLDNELISDESFVTVKQILDNSIKMTIKSQIFNAAAAINKLKLEIEELNQQIAAKTRVEENQRAIKEKQEKLAELEEYIAKKSAKLSYVSNANLIRHTLESTPDILEKYRFIRAEFTELLNIVSALRHIKKTTETEIDKESIAQEITTAEKKSDSTQNKINAKQIYVNVQKWSNNYWNNVQNSNLDKIKRQEQSAKAVDNQSVPATASSTAASPSTFWRVLSSVGRGIASCAGSLWRGLTWPFRMIYRGIKKCFGLDATHIADASSDANVSPVVTVPDAVAAVKPIDNNVPFDPSATARQPALTTVPEDLAEDSEDSEEEKAYEAAGKVASPVPAQMSTANILIATDSPPPSDDSDDDSLPRVPTVDSIATTDMSRSNSNDSLSGTASTLHSRSRRTSPTPPSKTPDAISSEQYSIPAPF